jgi:predicted ribosome quality control (RQC) complex YloA/Tae2 family protein
MNQATLQAITAELSAVLTGQKFGKIFQLARLRMAVDFRLHDGSYLFISVEPSEPRIYLIKRRLKDLEKLSQNPTAFTLFLRKRLANAILTNVQKDENERVLRFSFDAQDELEGLKNYTLVVQLTGRSANLFLLDANDFILDSLRDTHGEGQEIATRYAAPVGEKGKDRENEIFSKGSFETLSESLDEHYQALEKEREFQAKAKAARTKLKQEVSKREKLRQKLLQDSENHGDAEKWKRYGDLLLANLSTAIREGNMVLAVDYFDENVPTIEIEVDENSSLTEAAEKFFKRYTKARNAAVEIEKRLQILDAEISSLKERQFELEQAIVEQDAEFLSSLIGETQENKPSKSKDKSENNFTGARRYRSSDGFEILVGKAAKDNDYLTFRIAKSLDLWLHAADYTGSHVIIRNSNRVEIPQKTLLEAAELAAFFSQARNHPKAAVHYTERKYVHKPKGAVAGLVSLSSFKTILVEPRVSLENLSKR